MVLLACAVLAAPVKLDFKVEAIDESPPSPGYRVQRSGDSTVVSLYAGERPTGGYSIEVHEVAADRGKCVVRYGVKSPGADDAVTQALTYPAVRVVIKGTCKDTSVDPRLPQLGRKR